MDFYFTLTKQSSSEILTEKFLNAFSFKDCRVSNVSILKTNWQIDPFTLMCVAIVHLFPLIYNISLCEYAIIYSSIFPRFWLVKTFLLQTFLYESLGIHVQDFSWEYTQEWISWVRIWMFSTLLATAEQFFFKRLYHFYSHQ